jgi:hypothetical protein
MALTYGVTVKENGNFTDTIEGVFGSINICANFDFPPSTYVLPTLYAIALFWIYLYTLLSVFRAWIARLEDKISGTAFVLYSCAFIYFFVSAIVFSTIFAVQPDPSDPKTVLIHTLPFTNLVISLTILQIAVTWFGRDVSWKGLSHRSKLTKRIYQGFAYVCLFGVIITSIFKVIHQINSLADVGNHTKDGVGLQWEKVGKTMGIWFNVHRSESVKLLLKVFDKLWLLFALICPMLQSGYLTFKTTDTHLVILTIRDNRRANPGDKTAQEIEIKTDWQDF